MSKTSQDQFIGSFYKIICTLFSGFARGLRWVCLGLGGLVLAVLLGVVISGVHGASGSKIQPISGVGVLALHLTPEFGDSSLGASLRHIFAPEGMSVPDVVQTLDRAAQDPKIQAITLSFRGAGLDMAQVQELRGAVIRARQGGKRVYAYAPRYQDLSDYYLASSCDEIWLQPVGTVVLNGFGGNMPFFKGLLDKIGIRANFIQRKEYKTAMENMTENGLSKPSREMLESIYNNIADQVVADIAADRGVSVDKVWSGLNAAIYTGDEALSAKFITRIGHADELVDSLHTRFAKADEALDFIGIEDYRALVGLTSLLKSNSVFEHWASAMSFSSKTSMQRRVALVTIEGEIFSEIDGGMTSFGDERARSAEEQADAIEQAIQDPSIRAIIVRLDSPGGSPEASELIRRALERAHKVKKPVVVSMGSVAASGGYWIATAADHIFAQGTTLTGSIGVVGGKFDAEGLAKNLGVTWDGVTLGQNANIWSSQSGFNFSETERMNALMDDVYAHFTKLVVEGRHLSPDAVEKLARGRVWTGAQALDLGLVDELGGQREAVAYTAQMLGLTKVEDVDLVPYPAPLTPLEEIISLLENGRYLGQVSAEAVSRISHVMMGRVGSGVYAYDPALGVLLGR